MSKKGVTPAQGGVPPVPVCRDGPPDGPRGWGALRGPYPVGSICPQLPPPGQGGPQPGGQGGGGVGVTFSRATPTDGVGRWIPRAHIEAPPELFKMI